MKIEVKTKIYEKPFFTNTQIMVYTFLLLLSFSSRIENMKNWKNTMKIFNEKLFE
jgi:hypothetical protein